MLLDTTISEACWPSSQYCEWDTDEAKRARNAHWKHGVIEPVRAEIKQSDHPAGSMLGKFMNRKKSTGQEHNFNQRSSSSSNRKHFEQSVFHNKRT